MAAPKVQERERIGTDGGTVNWMTVRPFDGAETATAACRTGAR